MGAKRSKRRQGGESEVPGGGGRWGVRAGVGKRYWPEERRAAVEAYQKSGLSPTAFAHQWGVRHVVARAHHPETAYAASGEGHPRALPPRGACLT